MLADQTPLHRVVAGIGGVVRLAEMFLRSLSVPFLLPVDVLRLLRSLLVQMITEDIFWKSCVNILS